MFALAFENSTGPKTFKAKKERKEKTNLGPRMTTLSPETNVLLFFKIIIKTKDIIVTKMR